MIELLKKAAIKQAVSQLKKGKSSVTVWKYIYFNFPNIDTWNVMNIALSKHRRNEHYKEFLEDIKRDKELKK